MPFFPCFSFASATEWEHCRPRVAKALAEAQAATLGHHLRAAEALAEAQGLPTAR